ncbi:MAG: hypothetical protein J0I34_18610 [Pseudonocardia sp.]|uniref:hypothetical protein n=1 Tax=unclassified Pseudonocardia TaxID=2619320 RepID=UPI000A6ED473|nr:MULTISPECIES: hypothetical protein [unclassified Pseudonocardia]MBN9110778.1 hypothetical protein [Pseudonocardia sp.]
MPVQEMTALEPPHVVTLLDEVELAARCSAQAAGPIPWYLDPVPDGVAFRLLVRRWADSASKDAVLARIGCGTALQASSLAIAGLGRRPVTSFPTEPGVLAVLRVGERREPCSEELAMLAGLRHSGVPRRLEPPVPEAGLMPWLRRAAERQGGWARRSDTVLDEGVGPAWPDGRTVTGRPATMIVGADGGPPLAEVRLGRVIEAVRLTAAALGWWTRIAAAPADEDRLRRTLRGGTAQALLGAPRRGTALAVLELRPSQCLSAG